MCARLVFVGTQTCIAAAPTNVEHTRRCFVSVRGTSGSSPVSFCCPRATLLHACLKRVTYRGVFLSSRTMYEATRAIHAGPHLIPVGPRAIFEDPLAINIVPRPIFVLARGSYEPARATNISARRTNITARTISVGMLAFNCSGLTVVHTGARAAPDAECNTAAREHVVVVSPHYPPLPA
jgi:hypothetical protein